MTRELPEGWAYTSLKSLVGPDGLFTDGDWILSEHLKTGKDVRLIQLADVGIGVFQDKSRKYISKKTAEDLKVTYLHENDVLISRMADPLARACMLPRLGQPSITAVDVAVARCDETVCIPAYLMNACNSYQVFKQAESVAVGTTRKRISRKNLEQISVALPPIPEQQRLVAKLEELLGKVAECRNRMIKVAGVLKRFRQSVLAAACSGRLTADWREQNTDRIGIEPVLAIIRRRQERSCKTAAQTEKFMDVWSTSEANNSEELPDHWQFVRLSKLSVSFDYGTSAKSKTAGKVPVLRMGNLQNGEIDWSNLAFTSDNQEIKKYYLSAQTVLFNRTNSPELVGKTAIYRGERPAIFAGYLIRINPHPELNPEYLNLCLNTVYAREFYASVKTDGVSQSNINAQKLGAFEVPFCSSAEQKEIVRRVERLSKVADKIEARYQDALQRVEQLSQSILAKAFRGELVPSEDELAKRDGRSYESAEQLLRRIHTSREAIPLNRETRSARRTAGVV